MVSLQSRPFLLPIFLHFLLAQGDPSASTAQACSAISKSLAGQVYFPADDAYKAENKKYWSTALPDLKPACIVMPTSAQGVASAMQVLIQYPDVEFTVKSGGHSPNPGHSSIQDGVLIAMRYINGTTYDATKGVAYVKPGGEWDDVISAVEPHGVTVVGGRLGIVGIAGYLMQGGISFLSAQYGLACDSIVGWEMVMANGSVVNVDAASQPDLAQALKGSGNQFGITTQFTIKTHPIGKVWGGQRIYTAGKRDQIFNALHDFIPYGATDPKAAIIISDIVAIGTATVYLMFYFYDGEKPPTTGPFADFLKIDSTIDLTSTRTYGDLLHFNGAEANLLTERASFRSFTIPYLANNPNIYGQIEDKWKNITASYLDNIFHISSECSVDFQPLPNAVGKQSEANGGNAMGLRGSDQDRIILEIQCLWGSSDDDGTLYAMSAQLTDWLESQIPGWTASDGSAETYLPYFMNDATRDQNVTGSYRDYAKFKALQMQYDPNGVFRNRIGGFKY